MFVNCPSCHLSIRLRPQQLPLEHCPRCIARRRQAVPLFTSTLPYGRLAGRAGEEASGGGSAGSAGHP